MENKYNTMIYPFDVDSVSLIRHYDIVEDYNFVHVVSPNGWGLTGKDVGYTDDGEPLGIVVENDFNKALEDCDTVLFVKSNQELDFFGIVYPKMIIAAETSKNIVCTIKLEEKEKNIISSICSKNNKFFKYIIKEFKQLDGPLEEENYKIDVPVIFVAGLCERTNKFEIQLNIREALLQMGYQVSQIGTHSYCELMGFHSFPQFMFEKDFYEWEKITLFNHYVKKLEVTEEPDIIVIGIPGATMPIDELFTNKFGNMVYQVSEAISPDVAVLSVLYQKDITTDYFKFISTAHKNKYGFDIDCYNMANAIYNDDYSKFVRKVQYVTCNYKFISEKIKSYSSLETPVFNILDKDAGKQMTEFLVDKLSEYAI